MYHMEDLPHFTSDVHIAFKSQFPPTCKLSCQRRNKNKKGLKNEKLSRLVEYDFGIGYIIFINVS
jgi:hypothetical protein